MLNPFSCLDWKSTNTWSCWEKQAFSTDWSSSPSAHLAKRMTFKSRDVMLKSLCCWTPQHALLQQAGKPDIYGALLFLLSQDSQLTLPAVDTDCQERITPEASASHPLLEADASDSTAGMKSTGESFKSKVAVPHKSLQSCEEALRRCDVFLAQLLKPTQLG